MFGTVQSTIGFLLPTAIFFLATTIFRLGWLSWFVANIAGGILAFLVFYFKVDIYHGWCDRTKSNVQLLQQEGIP